jgi:uncharacterized protein YwgA
MKSINPKQPFTEEDFEKGLMLLGYLLPSSMDDIQDKETLNQFEKEQLEQNRKNYFKRVVLAAEILDKLHQEPTLGRVKFQKLVYLCEHAANLDFIYRYQKQTAGPFDNKFMHSIDKELKSKKWFECKKSSSGKYTRSEYIRMEYAEGYKEYYQRYFSNQDRQIQYVLELFRRQDTSKTELAATVHYCLTELSILQKPVPIQELLEDFYKWSPAKSRFSIDQIQQTALWLKEMGLIESEILL